MRWKDRMQTPLMFSLYEWNLGERECVRLRVFYLTPAQPGGEHMAAVSEKREALDQRTASGQVYRVDTRQVYLYRPTVSSYL